MLRLRGDDWINANPDAGVDGYCDSAATAITTQLEAFSVFDTVTVASTMPNSGNYQECEWQVTFVSSIGNLEQLEVQSYNYVTKSTGTFGSSSVASDDTVTVTTNTDGSDDAIKAALEELAGIGTVTVTSGTSVNTACTWTITFDTNAGTGMSSTLQVQLDDTAGSTGSGGYGSSDTISDNLGTSVTGAISQVQASTSSTIGGNFALGSVAPTDYMPYDVDASTMKDTLEALDTIGSVEVSVGSADETMATLGR